jgi:hypothetical protein
MIQDTEGQGAGIEWGADFGLADGEALPEDVEELTEAQYTLWKFVSVLQGINDENRTADLKKAVSERPTGLLVPSRKLDS